MSPDTHFPTAALDLGRLTFYISGPMTGLPRFGFPAFDAARDFLRATGHVAVSPADHDREVYPDIERSPGFERGVLDPNGPRFEDLIGWDLRFIASLECDAVLFLPGWENSRGAGYERTVAEACGKRLFYFDPDGPSMYEERPTTLIGVSGYAQAGKDTIGGILCDAWGFERVAFADALKAVLYDVDVSVRCDVDLYDWETSKARQGAPHTRALLQRLGVAVREHVSADAWVDAAFRKLKPGGAYVVTDLRFENEFNEIKRRGGQVWRVTRPGFGPANDHLSEVALDGHTFDAHIINDEDLPGLSAKVARHLVYA